MKKLYGGLRRFLHMQEGGIIIATIMFAIVVTLRNEVFISPANLLNVMRSTGFTLIVTIGMTYVLIVGGLDLSVGSVLGLSGTVCAMMLVAGVPMPLAILGGIATGMLVGFFNGAIIVLAGIPPLIVTLGMQFMARGAIFVLTEGRPVFPLPREFQAIEQNAIIGRLPNIIIIALILAIIAHIILKWTPFGREVYAVGGNVEAARISGVNINKVRFSVYALTGALAGVAGVMLTARLGSAQATAGVGFELTVIAAAIIGGTSTFAGVGTILGSVIGALFMQILSNSMTLMRIDVYWQNLVIGAILILAVAVDQYKRTLIQRKGIR